MAASSNRDIVVATVSNRKVGRLTTGHDLPIRISSSYAPRRHRQKLPNLFLTVAHH
jgi:hypothetical protein